ncbi:hypothetical protein EAF00_005679 [Botryotinia globosa]|nr:hypothetical protein EAF00_005679 [Botryotinia globosa]
MLLSNYKDDFNSRIEEEIQQTELPTIHTQFTIQLPSLFKYRKPSPQTTPENLAAMQKFLDPLLPQPRTTMQGKINIPSPSDSLREFSATSLDLLTQLLARLPGTLPTDSWLRDQAVLMQTFPPPLLHPKSSGLISRVAASLSSFRLGETKAVLCDVHKPLNPYLIRKIFLELTAECTTRLRRLTADVPLEQLPVNVQQFVLRMKMLNSIWMQPEFYRQAYQVQPCDPRYERVASGCEACILATIGGDRSIIRDLFASIWGRRKKNKQMNGWIDVVRAWASWQGDSEGLTHESQGLGREITRCRKHLQTLRRDARRERLAGNRNPFDRDSEAQTLLGNDFAEDDKDEDGDIENEIIDFYANMMSRTSLANTSSQESHPAEGVHAAFRDTVVFSDGFFHNASRPIKERSPTLYSRSVYNTSRLSYSGVEAEERASAYRQLVGTPESAAAQSESEEEDEPRFTNPFADPPARNNRPAYRGSHYENPRASPSPPSPRTTRHESENKPKQKHAPHHRRPDPQENPFTRKSHVARPEGKRGDRETRVSDFMI